MTVYLCTMISHEVDLFIAKTEEAWETVDVIRVVESAWTFSGKPKPLYLKNAWHRVEHLADKIEHIIVDENPSPDPWENEACQRNASLPSDLKEDDIVFCSDVDELDTAAQFPGLVQIAQHKGMVRTLKRCFYYKVNLLSQEVVSSPFVAPGSVLLQFSDLNTARNAPGLPAVHTHGGHFTYLMTPDQIAEKIQSFSHAEYNLPEFTDARKIAERIDSLRDPFDRNNTLRPVPLDSTFPAAFLRPEWSNWVADI